MNGSFSCQTCILVGSWVFYIAGEKTEYIQGIETIDSNVVEGVRGSSFNNCRTGPG